MKNKVTAIVLAGGAGKRMRTSVPKQFVKLAGKPLILHSLEKFARSKKVSDIVVVCRKAYIVRLKKLIKKNKIEKVYNVVAGGSTRQKSAFNGLMNCPTGTGFVLIHDAARPFADEKMIRSTLAAAKAAGAATTAAEVTDTIIEVHGKTAKNIPDRKKLKRVQTPQAFRYEDIFNAHKIAVKRGMHGFTDDCGLVMAMGGKVKVVPGSRSNMKITTREDHAMAEKLSKNNKLR